ncbi:MAG: SDR family oxidoreductase [Oleiphilus sp.]
MKIQDTVIAITGGAQGLGAAMALSLAKKGAHIALIDMHPERLKETQVQCESTGINAKAYLCNVSNEAEVETTFNQILNDFGQLDGLVNNAGILRDGLLLKVKDGEVINKLSLQQWQSVIDVNLTGVFLCGREAAAKMIESKRPGCIINISSVARAGNIGQSNYSAAKAGVVALSTTWAKELARYNIRAMAVAPGFMETEMTASMKPEAQDFMKKVIPLGKAGKPSHIEQTIVHIFENDYLTGRTIEVDGGLRV